ncbi:hypothetical protein ACXR0O_07860 [Verrucomicrobiota bacterium sgz303538]
MIHFASLQTMNGGALRNGWYWREYCVERYKNTHGSTVSKQFGGSIKVVEWTWHGHLDALPPGKAVCRSIAIGCFCIYLLPRKATIATMKTAYLFFGILVGLLSSARADVIIYKGTARFKTDIGSSLGAKMPISIYVLMDFDARQSTSILAFTRNKEKKYTSGGTPADQRTATAEIKGGKTVTILANCSASSADSNNFNYFLFSIRGVNSTITIRRTPTLGQVNRPRVLTGSSSTVSAQDGNGHFTEGSLTLSFQADATMKANNAGKTLAQVLDDTIAELQSKGFTEQL